MFFNETINMIDLMLIINISSCFFLPKLFLNLVVLCTHYSSVNVFIDFLYENATDIIYTEKSRIITWLIFLGFYFVAFGKEEIKNNSLCCDVVTSQVINIWESIYVFVHKSMYHFRSVFLIIFAKFLRT